MPEIAADLLRAWQEQPAARVRLIVSVDGALDERRAQLAALGADVGHTYRLTNALSLECTGAQALAIAAQPWVRRISPDTPLKALRRSPHG
ncbi:MAG: hypothetical protein ABFD20_11865 [Anaerolineales bacterium]